MKSSYRLLNYALLLGVVASVASACVVTSGDGKVDGFGGDDGGGDNTAGTKTNTGGSSTGTAGKTGTGGTSSTAGTGGSATAGTATGGSGGSVPAFTPGSCEETDTPSELPAPTIKADDNACNKCLKTKCKDEWQTCFGDKPKIACGWGTTDVGDQRDSDYGQWDCIQNCYLDGVDKMRTDFDALRDECVGSCGQQCNDYIMDATNSLLLCITDDTNGCSAECFPTE